MARTVTYSVVPRINPREKNDPPKYYAQAQARGDVNLREMAERIQSTCTVTKADVYAVLISLEDVVKEAIQNGEGANQLPSGAGVGRCTRELEVHQGTYQVHERYREGREQRRT